MSANSAQTCSLLLLSHFWASPANVLFQQHLLPRHIQIDPFWIAINHASIFLLGFALLLNSYHFAIYGLLPWLSTPCYRASILQSAWRSEVTTKSNAEGSTLVHIRPVEQPCIYCTCMGPQWSVCGGVGVWSRCILMAFDTREMVWQYDTTQHHDVIREHELQLLPRMGSNWSESVG